VISERDHEPVISLERRAPEPGHAREGEDIRHTRCLDKKGDSVTCATSCLRTAHGLEAAEAGNDSGRWHHGPQEAIRSKTGSLASKPSRSEDRAQTSSARKQEVRDGRHCAGMLPVAF